MFHKASDIKFNNDTSLEITFRDGEIKRYDVSVLFDKYPQMRALENNKLFKSGKLMGYGIIWNDDLDLETETVYEEGETIDKKYFSVSELLTDELIKARAAAGLTQKELAEKTGINQADISRIERGIANPSISTLERLAAGLNAKLSIHIA